MTKLINMLPSHFSEVKELNELFDVEEKMLAEAEEKYNSVKNNNFVQTCDVRGIENFENILGITPAPEDTLEFRKFRVLNRMSMKPPFTTIFLRERLASLLPEYNLTFDYDNYTMYIESHIDNALYFNELKITINTVKPCNIVLKYKPLIKRNLIINSETTYFDEFWNYILNGSWFFNEDEPFFSSGLRWKWNYILDGSWSLDQQIPFAYEQGRKTLKPRTVKSFNPNYLLFLGDFIVKSIDKVVLTNDEAEAFEVISFIKQADGVLEYEVPGTVGNIKNIKLYSGDMLVEDYDTIWLAQGVDTNIQHIMSVFEGVDLKNVKEQLATNRYINKWASK